MRPIIAAETIALISRMKPDGTGTTLAALHAHLGLVVKHGGAILPRHFGKPPASRGVVFTSVPKLIAAIDEYIAHHSANPKPKLFIWTTSARDILQKVIRANSRLSSKQNVTLH